MKDKNGREIKKGDIVIVPERIEIESEIVDKVSIDRKSILDVMTNWLNESSSETIIRVFNENFDGELTYNVDNEIYLLDVDVAKNLNIN